MGGRRPLLAGMLCVAAGLGLLAVPLMLRTADAAGVGTGRYWRFGAYWLALAVGLIALIAAVVVSAVTALDPEVRFWALACLGIALLTGILGFLVAASGVGFDSSPAPVLELIFLCCPALLVLVGALAC